MTNHLKIKTLTNKSSISNNKHEKNNI